MFRNGRRTLTTMIGVVVSAVLLFLLFEIPYSIRESEFEYGFRRVGGMDIMIFGIGPETAIRMREDAKEKDGQRSLAGYSISKLWISLDDEYLGTTLIDDFSEMAIPIEADRGALPQNDSEVIVVKGSVAWEEENPEAGQISVEGETVAVESNMVQKVSQIGDLLKCETFVYDSSYGIIEEWYAFLQSFGKPGYRTDEDEERIAEEWRKRFSMSEISQYVCGYLKDSERLLMFPRVSVLTDDYMRKCSIQPRVNIVLTHPEEVDMEEFIRKLREQYGLEERDASGFGVSMMINERTFTEDADSAYDAFLLLIALAFSLLLMLMIRNAFNISVDERLRDYGVLRCVGLTRRQIFKMLLIEAFLVALAGSLFGILMAYGLAFGGLKIASQIPFIRNMVGINFTMHAVFSWKAILYPAFVVFLATAMSMISPVEKLFRMSPIDAQRKKEKVRRPKGKSLVDRKKPGIERAYGLRSARRVRGRYIRTVVSFALGLALVTGAGTMMQTAIRTEYPVLHSYTNGAIIENAGDWSGVIQALNASEACVGMEGAFDAEWLEVVDNTDPGDSDRTKKKAKIKQVVQTIGVTDGIWNALVKEMEDPAAGVSTDIEENGQTFPALAVIPSYGHVPGHVPGDRFRLPKTDVEILVAGTVSEGSANQILSCNTDAVGIDENSEWGTYIFPVGKHPDIFSDLQAETLRVDWGKTDNTEKPEEPEEPDNTDNMDNPDNTEEPDNPANAENPDEPDLTVKDFLFEAGVFVEAASGQEKDIESILMEYTFHINVLEMEDLLSGLTLARNVFFLVLAFILIISTINTINVSRGEQFARRDEIFMLRAIGMSERQRRRMLLSESMSASILSVILGVGIGLMVAGIVTGLLYQGSGFLGSFLPDTMKVRFTPDYTVILISAAAVLLTGWIASVFVRKDGGISDAG